MVVELYGEFGGEKTLFEGRCVMGKVRHCRDIVWPFEFLEMEIVDLCTDDLPVGPSALVARLWVFICLAPGFWFVLLL